MPKEDTPEIDGLVDLEEIGRGGFSVVYAATQTTFGRRVAAKVVNTSGTDARRFEREALALGAMTDIPNVVQALSVTFTSDGRPALLMPLMPQSLAGVLGKYRACTIGQVAVWARQLGTALDHAHERGIMHRDIKPENVLISAAGDAYLADFGIATFDSMSAATVTSMSLSPPHAPPERFTGMDEDPIAGDIYSFASTLYTALSGEPPFGTTADGGTLGLLNRVANDSVAPIPGLSPALQAVLDHGLAKNPADRPRAASAIADAFESALATPLSPRPSPTPGAAVVLSAPDAERVAETVLRPPSNVVDPPDHSTAVRREPLAPQAGRPAWTVSSTGALLGGLGGGALYFLGTGGCCDGYYVSPDLLLAFLAFVTVSSSYASWRQRLGRAALLNAARSIVEMMIVGLLAFYLVIPVVSLVFSDTSSVAWYRLAVECGICTGLAMIAVTDQRSIRNSFARLVVGFALGLLAGGLTGSQLSVRTPDFDIVPIASISDWAIRHHAEFTAKSGIANHLAFQLLPSMAMVLAGLSLGLINRQTRRATLRWIAGPTAGRTVDLQRAVSTVGTAPRSVVPVPKGADIESTRFRIRFDHGSATIEPIGEVRVNDAPCSRPRRLEDGDLLAFGPHGVRFEP